MERVSSEHLRMRPGHTKEAMEDRRKDHISHFILRLAYCRRSVFECEMTTLGYFVEINEPTNSEDLRSWFLRQECVLFK